LITTIRSDRQRRTDGPGVPPGVLRFHPLGPGRAMQYHAIHSSEVTLGRTAECTIQVDDNEVSRVHARLERSKGYWQVVDNDSTNGTFLNGERIVAHPLGGGELIRLGGTFFRFFSQGLSPGSRSYEVSAGPIVAGPAFDELWEILDRAAGSALSVLVHGETGTGKELIASYLHQRGPRREQPFVPVNCAAIPRDLFESELFGHVKGAFTGAVGDKLGLLRTSSGGTLFLDEIGELPLECQAKLLRFLQDRQVWPVGSTRSYEVDIHLVCATNRDLEQLVREDLFRADLYARLADLVIGLPALRKRLEDIPLLVELFLRKHGDGQVRDITPQALEHLCLQRWPFNVRELESTVRRAMLFAASAAVLEVEHFAEKVVGPKLSETVVPARRPSVAAAPTPPPPEDVEDPRARRIKDALQRYEGDVDQVAAELGISRSQLYRRAQKFGINVALYRR
jgi:transcriptional regulator with PAS, ATPase and Fis domain